MSIEVPEYNRLLSVLNNSKLQTSNPSAYQVIKQLIEFVKKFSDSVAGDLNSNGAATASLLNKPFLLAGDPLPQLVFGRDLLAGIGITFDDSIPNERTISSSGSGSDHYDSPLSDGDLLAADLIFANGECIIVQVPV